MSDGKYRFDARKLPEAHAMCFRDYIDALQLHKLRTVFVDNTNTTVEEISPYVLGAQAYGWEVSILTILCSTVDDVRTCYARNGHSVPFDAVQAQHSRIVRRRLPPYWKARVISPVF